MEVVRASPTLRRRRLGLELRRLRETAGVTIEQVAERLECSASKISRIERGHSGATPRDVRDILAVYNVHGAAAEELVQVAREARQKGWWHLYGTMLSGAYVGLEAAESAINGSEAQVFPGLLQTADYAREMIRRARPDIEQAELDRRIHVRRVRQALLTQQDPVQFWVVLDEAVFHRWVGDRPVMRQQLDHLLEMTERPNVTVQVLPFAFGAHAGMEGSFAILSYDGEVDPDVVFTENAAGGLFLEKEEDLRRYHLIFDHLQASALPPDHSAAFVAARAKEM